MKRILITGKDSYIGTSVEKWLLQTPDEYKVDTLDVKGDSWRDYDFSKYDVVFHVAGIVHQKEKPGMKELYSTVNRDLPVEIAKKAKGSGVLQFIFMSTMAVYGKEGKIGEDVIINSETAVDPKNLYALSKVEAEEELSKLSENNFNILIVRPPMVYGPNCPGNYARLEKLAIILPMFPLIENKRSMVHINKLCQSIIEYIENENFGIFFPQDNEYVSTSLMVKKLAEMNGKSIHLSKTAGMLVKLFGNRIKIVNKIFGSLIYEQQ